ncbi:MAG: PH domain-containing protein [Acetobacter sp.]|nr:PH domain-containing protein [Acetobacter sp.]MBP5592126.1 PH domain-containing protein [bacterium]
MSFVENNLRKNEVLKLKAENSPVHIIVRIILSLPILLVCLNSKETIFLGFIWLIILIIRPVIVRFTTELAFTNSRVVGKIGLISTKTMDSPLNKIQHCSVEQGIFGRIFGYSTIKISSASGEFLFRDIKKAENFKQKLMEQIEIYDEERIKKQANQLAEVMDN